MKISAGLILFVFVFFLSLPTLVVIVDKDTNITFVFSNAEEEETNNSNSEIKIFVKNNKTEYPFLNEIDFKNVFGHYSESIVFLTEFDIVIPPPKMC